MVLRYMDFDMTFESPSSLSLGVGWWTSPVYTVFSCDMIDFIKQIGGFIVLSHFDMIEFITLTGAIDED